MSLKNKFISMRKQINYLFWEYAGECNWLMYCKEAN